MKAERIHDAIKPCEIAYRELTDSLALIQKERQGSSLHPVLFDACVKRFEVLFEYVWKLLKVAVEYQGREAPGPRPAIQEAIRFSWIRNPEFWALALDARNASVHDYFGLREEDYLKLMARFSQEIPKLLERLKSLK